VRRSTSIAGLCGVLVACASPPEQAARENFEIVLDTALQGQSTQQRAAWLLYATTRLKTYQQLQETRHNPAADDYLIELRARVALAGFWRDERKKADVPADEYLDRTVAMEAAGELEEHVLGAFLKPGWTIPPGEFERIDFAAVKVVSPGETPTYATAKPRSGVLWPVVPGSSLPDPIALHPQRVPCTESLPKLRRAITARESEREQLDGEPAAADDSASFVRLLAASRVDSRHRTRGATWVSSRPYWMLFIAGFCANEQQDYAAAERWLESAVALSPSKPDARNELTHSLVFQGKFDRADAILDAILGSSQDRCELGYAWRRRGYIRFEQRRLDESRAAYLRSLEYDPGSAIARSELELLRRTIQQEGGNPDWYVPPASFQGVTTCPAS
jgi:tetratricopeptide (TPR) repeat protein